VRTSTPGARARRPVRRWIAATCWFSAFIALWALWVAQSTLANWVAAVVTALLAALAARWVASRGLHAYAFRIAWLRRLPGVAWQIVADFGIVTAALGRSIARGSRDAAGGFVARELDTGRDTPLGATYRAFIAYAATWSPNSYVVDISLAEGARLNHDLVPHRASEKPA